MRARSVLVLLIGLAALSGCMGPVDTGPSGDGAIQLHIVRDGGSEDGVTPRVIPQAATKIRVRVWHATSGYNVVATAALSAGSVDLKIAVPEDDGYTVDIVSYFVTQGRPTALTGGRAPDVSVDADKTTDVNVTLRPWATETSGDTTVAPLDPYTMRIVATDADGLITRQTFESARLYASTTSFQSALTLLPSGPGSLGVVMDDHMSFAATAPDVSVITTLYAAALVEFTRGWRDESLADAAERSLFVELPNRHMGAALHHLVIDPTTGGIVIDVSSL